MTFRTTAAARRLLVFGALSLAASQPASAQVARGTVTDRASQAPVAGVLVSLVADSSKAVVGSALTGERGDFAVRAPRGGRYHLEVKRIGVRRTSTAPFELAAGETRPVDVVLDALRYTLPEVVVTAVPLCARGGDGARVASLWDEASTALTATQISLRDRLFQARVVRYVRELDPRTYRVIAETRSEVQGVVNRPFYSLPAESLSARGYWRNLPGGSTIYYAPDAAVLLSDSFLAEHCFRAVRGTRDQRGMAGLAFEPTRRRARGDVRGTLWLDDRTFELRYVEYRYTGLEDLGPDSLKVGGQVHFARLPSGAWIVRRWYIRMPGGGRQVAQPLGVTSASPSVLVRSVVAKLREEGGDVTAAGLRLFERPAVLSGTVRDSAGVPLPGATVRLSGTGYRGQTAAGGAYRIDSLPAGTFDVAVEVPGYGALGSVAAAAEVSLVEGGQRVLDLRAIDTRALLDRLCPSGRPPPARSTLRVNVRDSGAGTPLAFVTIVARWVDYVQVGTGVREERFEATGTSDSHGGVVFCDLPADTPLTVHRKTGPETFELLATLRLSEGQIGVQEVRISAK